MCMYLRDRTLVPPFRAADLGSMRYEPLVHPPVGAASTPASGGVPQDSPSDSVEGARVVVRLGRPRRRHATKAGTAQLLLLGELELPCFHDFRKPLAHGCALLLANDRPSTWRIQPGANDVSHPHTLARIGAVYEFVPRKE